MSTPLIPLVIVTTTTSSGTNPGTYAAALYADRTVVFSGRGKSKGTHFAVFAGTRASPTVTGFRFTARGLQENTAGRTQLFPTNTEFTALAALLTTTANSDLLDAQFTHPESW